MENMEYILSLAGAALSILAALLTIAVKFVKALVWKKYADMVAEAASIAGVNVDIQVMTEYDIDEIASKLSQVEAVLIDGE